MRLWGGPYHTYRVFLQKFYTRCVFCRNRHCNCSKCDLRMSSFFRISSAWPSGHTPQSDWNHSRLRTNNCSEETCWGYFWTELVYSYNICSDNATAKTSAAVFSLVYRLHCVCCPVSIRLQDCSALLPLRGSLVECRCGTFITPPYILLTTVNYFKLWKNTNFLQLV